MRVYVILLLILVVACGTAAAQPKHGDLVYCCGGSTGYFDPAKPGTFTTLALVPPNYAFHSGVRMAPDNTDLVVNQVKMSTPSWTADLVALHVKGGQTTIAAGGGGKYCSLDHDNKWILVGVDRPFYAKNHLYSVDHGTGKVVTYWSRPSVTRFESSVIDRDPGTSLPYAIAAWGTATGPRVLRADRQGKTTVIVNSASPYYVCAALHPRSGDYLLGIGGPVGPLVRVTKAGVQKTVVSGYPLNGIKVTQDDFAWCVTVDLTYAKLAALKVDLSKNAVVTLVPTGLSSGLVAGIDVYGSRTMVCNQQSPGTVTVKVQSRHPQAPGAQYGLAASFARRPGIKFANGEWLDLAADALFYLSALNLAPQVFSGFQGKLDLNGDATAMVAVPPGLPKMDDLAVFVGGIIFKGNQVIQVTNSHWFVLP